MKSRMMPILSLVVLLVAVATAVASAAQFDLGGKTVTIISNADVFASENMQIRRAEVEAQFNCKLVGLPVAMAEAPEVITARVMAGDSTYDVYVMNSRGYFPLVANNILLPIGELLGEEYYENLPPLARANIESLRYHGRLYGFGVKSSFASQCAIAWNKDMFEREGLPDLYEVYESGEWTYDTMIELAKTLTRDLDGDGVIDQWGIGGLRNYETLVRFAYSNGAEVVREDESGRWVFSYDQPEAIEALDMYRDCCRFTM